MAVISLLLEVLKKPSIWDMLFDLILLTVPLWIAVFVGVVVGWAWRPNWAIFGGSVTQKQSSSSSSASDNKGFNSIHCLTSFKSLFSSLLSRTVSNCSLEDANFNDQSCILKSSSRFV